MGDAQGSQSTHSSTHLGEEFDAEQSSVLNSESLMMRKMEQFDGLINENCLTYSEFESEMDW